MNAYATVILNIGGGILSSMQFLVFVALAVGGLIALGTAAVFGGHGDADHETDGQPVFA